MSGLSPRVRGNPHGVECRPQGDRSIPACAGEPAPTLQGACLAPVYPRVCGGTHPTAEDEYESVGLSPRVRGNRLASLALIAWDRSIPACAGEPTPRSSRPSPGRVYPRVCGGTLPAFLANSSSAGLSPRVRGNHPLHPAHKGRLGSIPACAGEPLAYHIWDLTSTTYPRVCGGIGLVFHHEASDGNGLVYRHTAADHGLEGPGPPAQV